MPIKNPDAAPASADSTTKCARSVDTAGAPKTPPPTAQNLQMEGLDYWHLCDELTVHEAAILVVGRDPSSFSIENGELVRQPTGYSPAIAAISTGLRRGEIKGKLVPCYDWQTTRQIEDSVDIAKSRVERDSLREWLAARGESNGFFFPDARAHDYLDPRHPRYAPKLAAAVRAWIAMEVDAIKNKTPKQALTKWLREHAGEFDLISDNGRPNDSGIEEVAKVANWQPTGGAPKTYRR